MRYRFLMMHFVVFAFVCFVCLNLSIKSPLWCTPCPVCCGPALHRFRTKRGVSKRIFFQSTNRDSRYVGSSGWSQKSAGEAKPNPNIYPTHVGGSLGLGPARVVSEGVLGRPTSSSCRSVQTLGGAVNPYALRAVVLLSHSHSIDRCPWCSVTHEGGRLD